MSIIEACFTGRLGSDPELRTSQAGKPWCRFSVAVGYGDEVQWVSVVAFGETAERAVERLGKGQRAYVEGAIKLNTWTDRDGRERHGLQCAAHYIDRQAPKAHKSAKRSSPAGATDARPEQHAIPF
jgi:single-strand DNA-binding protein